MLHLTGEKGRITRYATYSTRGQGICRISQTMLRHLLTIFIRPNVLQQSVRKLQYL